MNPFVLYQQPRVGHIIQAIYFLHAKILYPKGST